VEIEAIPETGVVLESCTMRGRSRSQIVELKVQVIYGRREEIIGKNRRTQVVKKSEHIPRHRDGVRELHHDLTVVVESQKVGLEVQAISVESSFHGVEHAHLTIGPRFLGGTEGSWPPVDGGSEECWAITVLKLAVNFYNTQKPLQCR
jgi:hypothetical protein